MEEVLKIKELKVWFDTDLGRKEAVRGVSMQIHQGEAVALVGESGCGKSVTAKSIFKFNDCPQVHISASEMILNGIDILKATEKEMLLIRGRQAGMIFQDPLSYLNPTMRIGKQITESLFVNKIKTSKECQKEAVRLLELVQIPQAAIRARQYPYQLSGGMQQRVMLAMAIACKPRLLVADEPTTALDATIQKQILILLKKMQLELEMSILFITHDLSVVANIADRVMVMYAGRIIEECSTEQLLKNPMHPYTKGLISSLWQKDKERKRYVMKGTPPNLYTDTIGCPFASRCGSCMRICNMQTPEILTDENGHGAACFLYHKDCPNGGSR